MAERNEDAEVEDPEGPDASDINDSETDPCPKCGAQVYEDTIRCPRCGTYLNEDEFAPHIPQWVWIGLALALIVVLLWILK